MIFKRFLNVILEIILKIVHKIGAIIISYKKIVFCVVVLMLNTKNFLIR